MKRLFLSLALSLFLASTAWSATVYVKDVGGDQVYYEVGASSCADVTNADTSSDVEGAVTAAGAGGTCYICEGTYTGTELDANGRVDILADNQTIIGVGDVTLDADLSASAPIFMWGRNGLTLQNINVTGGTTANIYVNDTAPSTISGLLIDNITSTGGSNRGMYLWNVDGGVVQNCSISSPGGYGISLGAVIGDLTIDNTTITTAGGHSIHGEGVDFLNKDIIISDCVFSNTTLIGVYLLNATTTLTMTNTIITGSGSSNVFLSGNSFSAGSIIQDCTMNANVDGDGGLRFDNTSGIDILDSVISNSELSGINIEGTSNDIIISGCEIYNSGMDGIDILETVNNITITKCKIYNNGDLIAYPTSGDGISCHGNTYNTLITFCEFFGNKNTGIAMVNSSDGEVYNCIMHDNGDSINGSDRGGVFWNLSGVNPTTSESWTMKNCIVSDNYPCEYYVSVAGKDIVTCDYNQYYHPDNDNLATIDAGVNYLSWAEFDALYEAHSANGDPYFYNASNDIFTLRGKSPCIDAGVDVSLTHDYNGYRIPNGSAPDIGAYEHYRKTYGSMHRSVCKKTSDAVLKVEESGLVNLDSTTGNIAIYLPPLSLSWGAPFFLHRDNAGVNTITIYANESGETIGGAANKTLVTQYDTLLVWGGTDQWYCQPYTQ